MYGEVSLHATALAAGLFVEPLPSRTSAQVPILTTTSYPSSSQNPIDTFVVPGENLRIPPLKPIAAKCKHPQVRVVARDEDTEFVECQHCGEVFDSIEYRDMMLEEEESRRAAAEEAD